MLVLSLGLVAGSAASAQTYGPSPPNIVSTISVTSGTATVVGSTTVATTGTTPATNVTGGVLILDSAQSPSPGAITISAVNGNALQAAGGTITVPSGGLTIRTQGGHAVLANGAASVVTLRGATPTRITTTGTGAGLVAIGGTIDATNVVIDNTGTAAGGHGAVAESGGTLRLHAGTGITTNAFNAVGLGASDTGSSIVADANIPIVLNGRGSMGIYLHDGGQVTLQRGSTLQLNGSSSVGIVADNTTLSAGNLDGLTINLNGVSSAVQTASSGVVALNNGRIALADLTVRGGNASVGAWALAGSSVTLTGRNVIEINATRGPVAYVLQSADLVTPIGTEAASFDSQSGVRIGGLVAVGTGARISSTGTTVNVSTGLAAAGAVAASGGAIDLTENDITSTGFFGYGIRVDETSAVIGRDSRVTASGDVGAALLLNGGSGSIDLTNTVVRATGEGTFGLSVLHSGTSSSPNQFRLAGGSLTSRTVAAVSVVGPLDLTITDRAVVTGGNGVLLTAVANFAGAQPTDVRLSASNGSVLTGDALVGAQATADFRLSARAHWTGAAFDVTQVGVGPTAIWTIPKDSAVTEQVTNAGLIEFTPPDGDATQLSSYKTLTTPNYLGRGGTLELNTFLGADGSPSDRLVIDGGSASGQSFLRIANTVGAGDLTTGNGILVVDAIQGGVTAPGAFALGGPVVAGPYEYSLYRSGVDGTGVENWYLRSELAPPEPPEPPQPEPPPIPDYRRETSLYAALPAMSLVYGRTLIDSLHERVGELRPFGGASANGLASCREPDRDERCAMASAGWGRIVARHGQKDGGTGGIFGSGPEYDYDLYALQAGLDLYRGVRSDGSLDHAGVYAAIGRVAGDVTHFSGIDAGTDTVNAYSFGGYWTHFGSSGWYLDGVLQGTWYDVQADSHRQITLQSDGLGVAASLEGGYPIQLGNGFILEPQAQAVYQMVDLGSANDGAADINFSNVDSLAARIGIRLATSWPLEAAGETGGQSRVLTAWVKASVWDELLGDPITGFSSATGPIPFHADLGGAWGELKLGVDAKIARNTSLYASASYEAGFDGGSSAYDGQLGIKIQW